MTESDNSFVAVNVDEAAFRKVFDRYYPRMLAFLRSFLQSDDDAEDVAQNVFVKLWMKREVLLDRESGHLSFQDDGEFRHQFLESPETARGPGRH